MQRGDEGGQQRCRAELASWCGKVRKQNSHWCPEISSRKRPWGEGQVSEQWVNISSTLCSYIIHNSWVRFSRSIGSLVNHWSTLGLILGYVLWLQSESMAQSKSTIQQMWEFLQEMFVFRLNRWGAVPLITVKLQQVASTSTIHSYSSQKTTNEQFLKNHPSLY